jgi:hypothetical protein
MPTALVLDEDEDEEMLSPVVKREGPEDVEDGGGGAGGKLEAAKRAERDGLDQLGCGCFLLSALTSFGRRKDLGLP